MEQKEVDTVSDPARYQTTSIPWQICTPKELDTPIYIEPTASRTIDSMWAGSVAGIIISLSRALEAQSGVLSGSATWLSL